VKAVLDAAAKDGEAAAGDAAARGEGRSLAFGGGKVSKEGVEWLTAKWGAAPKIVNPGGSGNQHREADPVPPC
jgi:hypothetical protein